VLLQETLKPRKNLPPLFSKLSERAPEKLHYLGVSYGLTKDLFGFWHRAQYIPVYIRLTQNELTGEHTCIMLKELKPEFQLDTVANGKWLESFAEGMYIHYHL
jgi:N-acetyltransferase 10